MANIFDEILYEIKRQTLQTGQRLPKPVVRRECLHTVTYLHTIGQDFRHAVSVNCDGSA